MSKSNANRLIALLEKFGPQFFHITQLTRISVAEYRAIAPAVRADGIEFDGELIPFHEENTKRIAAAVSTLSASQPAKAEPSFAERISELERAGERLARQIRKLRREAGGPDFRLHALASGLESKMNRLCAELG